MRQNETQLLKFAGYVQQINTKTDQIKCIIKLVIIKNIEVIIIITKTKKILNSRASQSTHVRHKMTQDAQNVCNHKQ